MVQQKVNFQMPYPRFAFYFEKAIFSQVSASISLKSNRLDGFSHPKTHIQSLPP
jgi:hypothetical protein